MHRIDQILVGLVVLASALYAFRALAPRTYRTRFLGVLAAWVERTPDSLPLRALARRLVSSAATPTGGGCGGCGSCESDAKTAGSPMTAGSPEPLPREVGVRLSAIGRRRSGPLSGR